METKLYPHGKNPLFPDDEDITHKPEDIRKHLDLSLKALNTDKIEMFYLRESLFVVDCKLLLPLTCLLQMVLTETLLTRTLFELSTKSTRRESSIDLESP